MSFVEFLMEYYFYILAVLIVLIVGVIGFLVDSKNKKKKSEVKGEINSNAGQAVNNIDPLQGASSNSELNNGISNMQPIANMHPMGGENLIQNQVQPQIQNNSVSLNGIAGASTGIVDNQNASIGSNNGILGMDPIITTNVEQGTINASNSQSMDSSIQPNFNNGQVLGTQVIQPIDANNGMNPTAVNNNLGGISDIGVLQGVQPIMPNNTSATISLDGNQMGMQNMQPDVTNVVANPTLNLNAQPQINSNMNQPLDNQVQAPSNDINNSVGAINVSNPQSNILNGVPFSPINSGGAQVNNLNTNVGNNMMGVPTNNINNNVQNAPNSNMNNSLGQMNGQVYMDNNSQPFDISSMFGNNQQ